jgi:RNA polymerase sigma factor (sigma-70 family)
MNRGQPDLPRAPARGTMADEPTDRQLLERFVARRDEEAFAAVVRRHGPLVRGVCRRVLPRVQDAEDAFQATFLVLARKASSGGWQESVGSWLYEVAYRLAHKARAADLRRQARERPLVPVACPRQGPDAASRELGAVIDEELARLPEKYQGPLLLCYLEGHTRDEAARQLGCPLGTLKHRLERGRALLRSRLARRGITLSAGLLFAGMTQPAGAGPTSLVRWIASAAMAGPGSDDVPPAVRALAEEGIHGMSWTKAKSAAILFLVIGLGAGVFGLPAQKPPPMPPAVGPSLAEKPGVKKDAAGDPLPAGALARLGTVRFRHGEWVTAMAYSPDGRTVASAAGRTIRLWDPATGKEVRQLLGHEEAVDHLAFSPDGKTLASGGEDNVVVLWDPATGKEVRRFTGHKGKPRQPTAGITALFFSPDGAQLISGGRDRTVRIRDVNTGKEVRRYSREGRCLALSPDGRTFAVLEKGRMLLWEPAAEKEVRLPRELAQAWAAFSPDGKTLAVGGSTREPPGEVRLWDVATGKEIRPLTEKCPQTCPLAFSPDGKALATTSTDGGVRLYDVASGKVIRDLGATPRFVYPVKHLAFSPDGKSLLTAGAENACRLWDVAPGKELSTEAGPRRGVTSLAFSPDGKRLVVGAGFMDVRLWDVASASEIGPRPTGIFTNPEVFFSPSGRPLAASSQGVVVCLWDFPPARERWRVVGDGEWTRAALSPDGERVAVCSGGKYLHVFDAATGKEVFKVELPSRWVNRLTFSPDGKLLAGTSGADRSVFLWEAATGQARGMVGTVRGSPVTASAFSTDGRMVAGTSIDTNLHVWEITTGRERLALPHGCYLHAVAFSPDGRLVATANHGRAVKLGSDGRRREAMNEGKTAVRIWDLATGKEVHQFVGHTAGVTALAFFPDGSRLASGSDDTTVVIWDMRHVKVPPLPPPLPRAGEPSERALDRLWEGLGGKDAARAYRHIWLLAATPRETVSYLKKRLRPVPVLDKANRARAVDLIDDLGSDSFAVRDWAARGLEKLGESAVPLYHRRLKEGPPLEVRLRLERLLEKWGDRDVSPARLREVRALEVLERIGTAEARRLVEKLAGGEPEARLTRDARAARKRFGPEEEE